MVLKHQQMGSRTLGMHYVNLESGSKLRRMIGDRIMVNSMHHQAVKDVAPGFWVVATASDGIVEAIEKRDYGFCVGVQWHPEEMVKVSASMKPIFSGFVKAARRDNTEGRRI
jgi:putative glutamine amidotransferase